LTLYGGIEGGGTKFVCAVGTGPEDIQIEKKFPTTSPEETLCKVVEFFKGVEGLSALGVACFGPLGLDPTSPKFGHILSTPKPGWTNIDVVGFLRSAIDIPVGFDTDVNGAALAEERWGAAKGFDPVLYMTIGTGIGGGLLVNGKLLHGLIHPEMGHLLIRHDWQSDPFKGTCPFHSDCFEGLASGLAIEARWGQKAEILSPDHPAWNLEAHYIALALESYICTISPQKIILGGGVAQQIHILPLVRKKVQEMLSGYIQSPNIIENISEYIVLPSLGNRSGVLGAIALAELAHKSE
jgi:fructokinase